MRSARGADWRGPSRQRELRPSPVSYCSRARRTGAGSQLLVRGPPGFGRRQDSGSPRQLPHRFFVLELLPHSEASLSRSAAQVRVGQAPAASSPRSLRDTSPNTSLPRQRRPYGAESRKSSIALAPRPVRRIQAAVVSWPKSRNLARETHAPESARYPLSIGCYELSLVATSTTALPLGVSTNRRPRTYFSGGSRSFIRSARHGS